jgi:hypothetical protein
MNPASARRLAAVMAFASLAGCGQYAEMNRAAKRGDPAVGVRLEQVPVRGFTATARRLDGSELRGELLASDDRALWIEDSARTTRRLGFEQIDKLELDLTSAETETIGLWTALGALSTVSHGVVAIFTAPTWLLVGTSATIAESSADDADVRAVKYPMLNQFARFPQGLPPGWPVATEEDGAPHVTPSE